MYEYFFRSSLLGNSVDCGMDLHVVSRAIGSNCLFLQGTVIDNSHTSYFAPITIVKNEISSNSAVRQLEVPDGLMKIHATSLDAFTGYVKPGIRSRKSKVAVSGYVKVGDLFTKAGERTGYGEVDGHYNSRSSHLSCTGSFLIWKGGILRLSRSMEIGALSAMKYQTKKGRVISHTCEVEYLD